MKRTFHYTIAPKDQGVTIGTHLRSLGYSRHLVNTLRDNCALTLNGQQAKLYEPLSAGALLDVTIEEHPTKVYADPASQVLLPLHILWEDEDILVVDKAAGMPVHQSARHRGDTLADAVNAYYAQKNDDLIYRCINRLDADTSGLVLIAKHMLSGCILSQQMKERRIHRTYTAIVHGKISSPGLIDAPIARKNGSVISRCIDANRGERAVTHYCPLSYLADKDMTCLELVLETGRTHQIRVHMTSIGHPLVGDFLYTCPEDVRQTDSTAILYSDDVHQTDTTVISGSSHDTPGSDASQTFAHQRKTRQALHSSRLRFTHPITGEDMDFTSQLPEDMQWLLYH